MTQHNKLVRDKIPEILQNMGFRTTTRTITGPEMLSALRAKIDEEVAEYDRATDDTQAVAELADLIEVILAIAGRLGYDEAEIQRVRAEKAAQRGAFEAGCYLVDSE
jgi:predicted house-cleaning noncanonical NTP pyrophosphatase (MazG superfamily)